MTTPSQLSSGLPVQVGVQRSAMMERITSRVTLKVTNKLDEARILVIEPWASEYLLPAGKSLDVVAEGDLSFPLEVEVAQDHITVYAFDSAGASVAVRDNGQEAEERRR